MTSDVDTGDELGLDVASVALHGLGYGLLGSFFLLAPLPAWRPLAWALGCNVLLHARRLVLLRPGHRALPAGRRRLERRVAYAACMAWAGTAAFWLLVPASAAFAATLAVVLLVVTAMVVVETPSDPARLLLSLLLLLGPSSLRLALQPDALTRLIGLGGLFLVPTLFLLWKRHHALLAQQQALRHVAERSGEHLARTNLERSRFFAAASHDLRQPTHALGLFLGALEASVPEPHRRAWEGAHQSWVALSGLIDQLTELSTVHEATFQPRLEVVPLEPLLRAVVTRHQAGAMEKRVRLVALVPPGALAHVDPAFLERIVANLVDNALKFARPEDRVAVVVRQAGASWRVQVRDSGPGIAPADHARIFEAFTQLSNPHRDRARGQGLGLAIARRFATLLGSTLTVRSETGRGATFELRVPRAEAPHRVGAQRVLIVDDDPLVAHGMRALIEAWGLTPIVVHSAEAALRAATAGDLALCDVRLPGETDGLALAVALRRAGVRPGLITGEVDPALPVAAQREGLPLLKKPVTADALRALLERLGDAQQA